MGMLDGLLGGIGRGLRAGSGVLNEQVFQNNEALRQKQMQDAETRKAQMFKYVWEGIQGGSVDPQKGLQAMAQIDPQATQQIVSALGGGIGPGIEAQQAQAEYAYKKQQRAGQASANVGLGLDINAPDWQAKAEYDRKNPPPDKKDNALVNLDFKGRKYTFRRGDLRVQELLDAGATEWVKPSSGVVNNIYNKGEGAFQQEANKRAAIDQDTMIKAGDAAAANQQTLAQTRELFAKGAQTNRPEEMLLGAHQMAEGLGLDINEVAAKAGIKLGKLSTKEEINRLMATMTVQTMAGMDNGNLNQGEVAIITRSAANPGRTTEANIEAIAAASAASDIAALDAQRAAAATTGDEQRKVRLDRARRGTKPFMELKKKYADQMRKASAKAGDASDDALINKYLR